MRGGRAARRPAQLARLAPLLALLLAPLAGAGSSDPQWLDVESRIQYAFYTEDQRSLGNVLDALAAQEGSSPLRSYYLALANYRLALLRRAPGARGDARAPAERCADEAAEARRSDADAAEALALESACLDLSAQLKALTAPLLRERSGSQLHRALELAPHNPRVLLIQALGELAQHSKSAPGLAHLQQAIAAFETERAGTAQAPGWGAAEAYAALGRSYLERGDAIAARGALEHALLLVPDFAYAHRLMARITAG
ncbi:MAG TPA: hypothetical protein VME21_03745 [Steroidobacteraceae bacterium]|nr:hypothetical protein [Steroidobacteraceae bacterium]